MTVHPSRFETYTTPLRPSVPDRDPPEAPPNIGLISYPATYARINDFGFIEAPYRVIEHTRDEATGEILSRYTTRSI